MDVKKNLRYFGIVLAFISVNVCVAEMTKLVEPAKQESGKLTEMEATKLGTQAYIYGYPLVTMDLTRRIMTNVAKVEQSRAPINQFANARKFPDASFRDVTTPNADTLYSSAWLDVSKEPIILHVPDEHGRYYLMPMLSGWTNVFASPGTRTTGTRSQDFAITGPNWKGVLPHGVKQIKAPTSMVWIIGRTYTTGTNEDYSTVHAIQDKYVLTPLSYYGKTYSPSAGNVDSSLDMKTAVRDQVNAMTAADFFNRLALLLKDNPPAAEDAAQVATLKKIGIVPGEAFDLSKQEPAVVKGLEQSVKFAQLQIMSEYEKIGTVRNGWKYNLDVGTYGTNYLNRALVTSIGLGANLPEDAIYPMTQVDKDGKQLNGANKYVIHFRRGKLPPVKGFWSLTLYNDQFFFIDNPLNRYNINERNNLKVNPNGTIDIYIQAVSPGANKETNWLPAPQGDFVLVFRFYWPKPDIASGRWMPPVVQRV